MFNHQRFQQGCLTV